MWNVKYKCENCPKISWTLTELSKKTLNLDKGVCSIDDYVETVQTATPLASILHNFSNSPPSANRTFKGREYTAQCSAHCWNPFGRNQISNLCRFSGEQWTDLPPYTDQTPPDPGNAALIMRNCHFCIFGRIRYCAGCNRFPGRVWAAHELSDRRFLFLFLAAPN